MKSAKLTWILGILACTLPACGSGSGSSSDDYLDAAPEMSALQLSVTDDATSEGTSTDADAIDAAQQVTQALGESGESLAVNVAPELEHCRAAVKALNEGLRDFLQPIVALVRNTEPTTVGRVRTWGPVTRGAAEFQFVMRHGTLRHFGWLLQARPAGTTENYTIVAAGGITVGYAARRGIGTVGVDLDRLATVDPTVAGHGALLASFAHGPNGSTLAYRLRDFSLDAAQKTGVDALVQGVHLKAGYNRLRLAYYGNVADTATDAPELVLARVRQERAEGGRADLLVTGGDVADGKVWVVSECWSPALQSTFRIVRDCPNDGIGGASCQIVSTTGDSTACPPDLSDADLPPADPLTPMPDPQSPEGDLTPPTTLPDGNPPTDS